MDIQYFREYSQWLKRDMEFKVYGYAGQPFLFFPCQNGRIYDFENFGMLDQCWQYIENGQMQLFTADSIDGETWSNQEGSVRVRMELQERWYHYIVDELVPRIFEINAKHTDGGKTKKGIIAMGFSMGGYHSTNFFFRRPDIFIGNLSLSGLFKASYFIGDYMDENVYNNSPIDYLRNMPKNHPYIPIYNRNKNIICMGQGAWEGPMLQSARELQPILEEKGIKAWIDYWGFDVCHDWNWWKKELEYFLPFLLKE